MNTTIDPEASAAGRALVARRRQVPGVCANPKCGRPFVGTVRRRYCSPACKLVGWRNG